jgi:MFS family permease
MAIVLFLPLFQQPPGLGAKKYGFAITAMTGGMFLGMVFTSVVDIAYSKRLVIFITSGIIFLIYFALVPMVSYKIMLLLLMISGFFNGIVNVFIQSSSQLTVPQEMRGKVFSLSGTVLQALTPIGMAVGGILAEFIPIKYIISTCFTANIFGMLPLMFSNSFRLFINYNPDTQTLEDLM